MPDEPTSMQAQSNLGEAQDSVHKARRAVAEALSNTTTTSLEQASHAVQKAQHAVAQCVDSPMGPAVREVQEELSAVEADFRRAEQNT